MEDMKKKKGNMPEHEKHAKMAVLSHLRDMAQDAMGNKLNDHSMKKVSVMSDSPEGLQHGLHQASGMLDMSKELAEHKAEGSGDMMSPDHMDMQPHVESEDPYENLEDEEGGNDKSPHDMDHNELGEHIKKLQALHHSMKEE